MGHTLKKIGILGGGQLARMLVESFNRYDASFRILSKEDNSPAGKINKDVVIGDWDEDETLLKFARGCDVITLENEFINHERIKFLEALNIPVAPTSEVVRLIQDKYTQKKTLKNLGIPVAGFSPVNNTDDIKKFAEDKSYPVILKSRTMGYDGKGNIEINSSSEIESAFETLSDRGNLFVEEFIPFLMELAVQTARNTKGEMVLYPIVETIQKDHICHIVKACRDRFFHLREKIHEYCRLIMTELDYVGMMGIEIFLLADGSIKVNELAPRVHNSGHYTIEGCVTSQFENHIRAICGYPPGSTAMTMNSAVMINILGERNGDAELHGLESMLNVQNTFLHIYGKTQTRVDRKMGHITALDDNPEVAYEKAIKARGLISI
ncbi:MAG: 5-(carboxyamino)imidazole ribonucleotide synthase [Ignavibacteriaceae bacterium]|nr:5-(carboxyamino)imidazole ribonucleotide synthase [Ignavibacteriaceae bacterium]